MSSLPEVVDFLDRNYRYKPVATQFVTMLDWHRFRTLTKKSSKGIEPAQHPLVQRSKAFDNDTLKIKINFNFWFHRRPIQVFE